MPLAPETPRLPIALTCLALTLALGPSSGCAPTCPDPGPHADEVSTAAESIRHRGPPRPPSCNAADLALQPWPLDGAQGKAWLINNYVDLDPSAGGLRDWMGFTGVQALTYDGHRGVDIDIPSFRQMDDGSAVIRATAPGVVTVVDVSHEDRHVAPSGDWNVVQILNSNGFTSFYGHLKKDSARVAVGDSVSRGQILAVTGSSGYSTQPHLHFEVHDCAGEVVEPFLAQMWTAPPAYDGPSDVMDVMLFKNVLPTQQQIEDPPPDVTLFKPTDAIGIGLSLGARNGDLVALDLVNPAGATSSHSVWTADPTRYGHLFPHFLFPLTDVPGQWTLKVSVNGALKATRLFNVSHYDAGSSEVARHGVPAADYQGVFEDVTAAGYRLVWIDGYDVGGNTFYNAIFQPAGNVRWRARHGLTSADYQAEFDHRDPALHPVQVESYLDHGAVRYALILTDQPTTPWVAYHGRTEAEHQALFEQYRAQGYRPIDVSVVSVGGTRLFTALYDQAAVPRWDTHSDIKASDYQAAFDAELGAGLFLSYLNAYRHQGEVYFTAVWTSLPYGAWKARHGLSAAAYQSEWSTWTGLGYSTRVVTGYDDGGPTFAALWTH
jgi:murein DD-endopeptidase MepM/ murein hydrolase activator NlpD